MDNDDLDLPQVQDIHNIWDDERNVGVRDDEDDADDDMDNFIEYEDEYETGGAMDEEEREERRKERRRMEKARRKAMGRPELAGIDAKWVVCVRYIEITHEILSVALGTRFMKCSEMVMSTIGRWWTMMKLFSMKSSSSLR